MSSPSLLFQVIALNCDSANSPILGFACVIGVVFPVVRSMTSISPGAAGVETTATPRLPSADTDSIRPDHSPPAICVTAPVATFTRCTDPRARTCAPKTIDWPSGAQLYCAMSPLNDPVRFRGSPPSAGTTHSLSSNRSQVVFVGARYDSILPSGDHWTLASGASFFVSVLIAPPLVSTVATSV